MNRSNSWKYNHDGAGYRNPKLRIWGGILFLGSIMLFLFPSLPVLSALFFLVAIALLSMSGKKQITINERYLICGDSIVYFGNITHAQINEDEGTLNLRNMDKQVFVLERSKFPTNARKTDKIRKNMDAKFLKVSERILNRITSTSPTAEITRNPRSFPIT